MYKHDINYIALQYMYVYVQPGACYKKRNVPTGGYVSRRLVRLHDFSWCNFPAKRTNLRKRTHFSKRTFFCNKPQRSVTKNETYQPVGTFCGGWYVNMIFHGVISQQNVPTSGNVRTFRNELSFVTNPRGLLQKRKRTHRLVLFVEVGMFT